ncbi:hypothetical protein EDB83DRAFT_2322279 [Lactarius deliciosus]|nr:hypothetical protein EDB83DRAFT_2322279 [Lactarius deliciosus]
MEVARAHDYDIFPWLRKKPRCLAQLQPSLLGSGKEDHSAASGLLSSLSPRSSSSTRARRSGIHRRQQECAGCWDASVLYCEPSWADMPLLLSAKIPLAACEAVQTMRVSVLGRPGKETVACRQPQRERLRGLATAHKDRAADVAVVAVPTPARPDPPPTNPLLRGRCVAYQNVLGSTYVVSGPVPLLDPVKAI